MKTSQKRVLFSLVLLTFVFLTAIPTLFSQLATSAVFGNNMVLQRNQLIRIWGTAPPGTAVHLSLHTQLSLAFADEQGHWEAILGALPAGGPYELNIYTDQESIVYQNILLGEVWVFAGQSNMQWRLKNTPEGATESASANFPQIRLFEAPENLSSTATRDLPSGNWSICTPITSRDFSAISFYFGRQLHQTLNVPIGLVNISWGGTKIDSWISPDGLAAFPELADELAQLPNLDLEDVENSITAAQNNWDIAVDSEDIGLQQNWQNNIAGWQSWPTMLLPKPWESDVLPMRDGSVWFKKSFTLTATQANQNIELQLGKIDDSDQTWINGQLVGSTDRDPGQIRNYSVAANLLQTGENIVTVRVRDYGFVGGMLGGASNMRAYQDMWQVSLAGYWNYQVGTPNLGERPLDLNPNDYPSLIYNGMVNPFRRMAMAGVVWYQGESDTDDPYHYRDKQIKLIDDWRAAWGIGDFPFLVTQLPYFRTEATQPGASSWATLRESQTYALKRDNTAVVTMIDTGDITNIHPNNKPLTSNRLANNALKLAYNINNIVTSPTYFLSFPAGSSMSVIFRNYGSSLTSLQPNNLRGFSIAGSNGQFVAANAQLTNSQTVSVSSPSVPQPKYVRYAWADNPGSLNLVNAQGLPVAPFRTDTLPTPYE
jgi:sialate O-acetylesterase